MFNSAVSNNQVTRGTFGLGEVIDDERICWNSRRCCRYKKCCPCLVITSVIMDILGFIEIIFLWACGVTVGLYIMETDKEEGTVILKLTEAFFLVYFLELILMGMKIYYGMAWFCRGRTR